MKQRDVADGYVYIPALFPRDAVLVRHFRASPVCFPRISVCVWSLRSSSLVFSTQAAQERMTERMADIVLEGDRLMLLPDAQPKILWKTGWLQVRCIPWLFSCWRHKYAGDTCPHMAAHHDKQASLNIRERLPFL